MARDVIKAAEEGRLITEKRRGLTLSFSEIRQLLGVYKAGLDEADHCSAAIDLLNAAYCAGIAVGLRNAKR